MASIPSNYDINVAQIAGDGWVKEAKGRYMHFVKMELGFTRTEEQALAILADTRVRYPMPEFKVTMTRWECGGRSVGDE